MLLADIDEQTRELQIWQTLMPTHMKQQFLQMLFLFLHEKRLQDGLVAHQSDVDREQVPKQEVFGGVGSIHELRGELGWGQSCAQRGREYPIQEKLNIRDVSIELLGLTDEGVYELDYCVGLLLSLLEEFFHIFLRERLLLEGELLHEEIDLELSILSLPLPLMLRSLRTILFFVQCFYFELLK